MHPQPKASDGRIVAAEKLGASDEDVAILRLISEQVAIPLDQLARFQECDIARVRDWSGRVERAGCLRMTQFQVGELPWVWLTRRGARFADTGCSAPRRPPAIARLDHLRAVNEVRLYLTERAPHGRWTSENQLRMGSGHRKVCPNGAFEIDGKRQAIRVALSYMQKSKPRKAIAEASSRYDEVIYFCGPRTQGLLRAIQENENWPKLVVREMPNYAPAPKRLSIREIPLRRPTGREVDTLRLMAEQGAIPVDQLSRFLELDVEELVEVFSGASYVQRESLIAREPDWVWLTERGVRLSGTELPLLRPRAGGLPKLRALNEARLLIEGSFPTAEWIGRRVLLRERGNYAQVPGGVVELEGMRHSVDVKLNRHNKEYWVPLITGRCEHYDAVVVLCPEERTRAFMEALQDEHRWHKVLVRDLPVDGLVKF
jgi:hypothetical protein